MRQIMCCHNVNSCNARMLRRDKEATGEKFSSFSGYRKQPLSPSRETTKTKMRKVRLCESRLFLRSSLGSRRALIVSSLAILSMTRKQESFFSLLFSLQFYRCLILSRFFAHLMQKNILCIYDTIYTVLSP